ncbi:MAG: hypothetical protein QM765_42090 [Myxococcales bacterium]
MRRCSFLVVGVLAVLLSVPGCGANGLSGSLSEAFDLSYSDIVLKRSESAFQVLYTKSYGNETVVRLTVATAGIDTVHGGSVNLAAEYAPGHPRAAVSRALDGEPVRSLPVVVQGDLTLNGPCLAGQSCSGTFSLRFGEGGDLGAGRTLVGIFSGTVQGAN